MTPAGRGLVLDFRKLAALAWRRRFWLLKIQVAVVAAAIGVTLLLPRWYTASVTLVPAPKEGLSLDFSGIGAGLGGAAFSLGNAPTPQDQLKMVVGSRAVADSMVQRFDLVRRWKLKRRVQAREKLAEHTTMTTPKEGQMVIEIEARTPALARDMAAAYAEFAGSEAVRLKTSLASQRRVYLEARFEDIERELDVASERMRNFEEEHGAVALPEQTRETMNAAGTLQAQVALLETELAAARRYFTDQAPAVRQLQDRIAELKRQLNRIARHGGTLLLKAAELPALKQEYMTLTREQLSLTAVSELLRRVYEQARVEEANPVPTFSVLDYPEVPERHSRPKRATTVAVALALSVALSLGYRYGREVGFGNSRAEEDDSARQLSGEDPLASPERRAA